MDVGAVGGANEELFGGDEAVLGVEIEGAVLVNDEGLIVNEAPDDAALADCKTLGAKLVG